MLLDHRCCGSSDKDFQDRGISALLMTLSHCQRIELGKSGGEWVVLGWAVATASAERLGEICSG